MTLAHQNGLLTDRLKLLPATPALARAELEDRDEFSRLLGAKVPGDWPPEFLADALPYFLEQLERNPQLSGWLSWYWISQDGHEPILIGSGGFKGPPLLDGTVEIGYSILPELRGRGYATEAARRLVRWAFAHRRVTRVVAEADPANARSVRVLDKLGFRRVDGVPPVASILFQLTRSDLGCA